jgi:23S rRNA (uridine2552-2'-O)-methyltransferase
VAKKGSSRRWVQEHLSDEYVKKAQKEGYRCRAVYKLLEIIEKGQLIKNGDKVLDLGAAPGGWSQVALKFTGKSGQVIARSQLSSRRLYRTVHI